MDNKTKGAWIVHHTNKLVGFTNNADNDFDNINAAGKCGLLLSSLASSEDTTLTIEKINALAKVQGISKLELPTILKELEKQKLIVSDDSKISVLGLTTAATLGHTASIFEESNPLPREQAVIDLAEKTSDLPCDNILAQEYISDIYKIPNSQAQEVLEVSETIGFIDFEQIEKGKKLVFNGNLFRRNEAKKISAVCSSISSLEEQKLIELNDLLMKQGCISLKEAYRIMGEALFKKLQSIGLYDVNTVSNEKGSFQFVTKPSAFSKFSETIADDAFDLAKVFVTSLTYGMTQSSQGRGRITMIQKLMQKLINGGWVGPATAIGQDYQVLEMRGVIQLKSFDKEMFHMKLLKKDVGELALKVIIDGDVSSEALNLPSASITSYESPEKTRSYERKNQTPQMKQSISEVLYQIRTTSL
jgi:hypothetical protein